MFDAVRNNKRIVQGFLALITLPFAFFGVDSYVSHLGDGDAVAQVGDLKITPQNFQMAMREQQDRMRTAMGGQLDPKLFDNPEARKAVLTDMINQRLMIMEGVRLNMMAGNDLVRSTIRGIDVFHANGQFSNERYEEILRRQGLTPAAFEAQLRQDITTQQLSVGIGRSVLTSRTALDTLLRQQVEQRDVRELRLPLETYLDKVRLEDDAARKDYEANGARFDLPEQARVEYLVLSLDAIAAQTTVPDSEVRAAYENRKDRYGQPEQRRASHILITPEKGDKAAAESRAQDLLKEVRKNPAAFAELAKKNSRDPGSAARGGDLGFFGRGAMVKPFDDAVFSLKEGEISGLVESEFGFHIIRLTGVQAAKVRPLADVRGEIEAELKKGIAARKYAEAAEAFSNMVYEQSDSLKPAAEKFRLSIRQSDWLTRQPGQGAGPLANEKLLAAIFSDEVAKNHRNTEAVEAGANTLVAARVVEYKPVSRQPFESVRAGIESRLKREAAEKLAVADGEARLAALKSGEDKQSWAETKRVSRMDARQIPGRVAESLFRLDPAKSPAYAGAAVPGAGYVLIKQLGVKPAELDEARLSAMRKQVMDMLRGEEMQSYLAALRERYKVSINQKLLDDTGR